MDAIRELDKLLREAGVRVLFGLRQQGHFDTVARMRGEGASWADIGKQIGWSGDAVEQHFKMESRQEFSNPNDARHAALKQQLIDRLKPGEGMIFESADLVVGDFWPLIAAALEQGDQRCVQCGHRWTGPVLHTYCGDCDRTARASLEQSGGQWRPIATFNTEVLDEVKYHFVVRPRVGDERWLDTSGNPIDSPEIKMKPRLHTGLYRSWSAMDIATHWMPLPALPPAPAGATKTQE